MESVQWRKETPISHLLWQEPYNFDFDQAVFILDHLHQKTLKKTDVSCELYTFEQAPHIDFEAIAIKANVSFATQASPLYKLEINPSLSSKPILWINFLSLAGAQGPLPISYTEKLLEKLRNKDESLQDFLDIFNHRLATMWYAFHKKIRPSLNNATCRDSLVGQALLHLNGNLIANDDSMAPPFQTQQLSLLPSIRARYPFLFWKHNRSTYELEKLIKVHFKLTARITSFKGEFQNIIPAEQTCIGLKKGNFNMLGKETVLGTKVWIQSAGIHITLFTSCQETFNQLLPINPNKQNPHSLYHALQECCDSYIPSTVSFKIIPQLTSQMKKHTKIMTAPSSTLSNRLGFNTWLS